MSELNLYNEERTLETWISTIKNDNRVTQKSQKGILEFVDYLALQNVGTHRQVYYLKNLRLIAITLGSSFPKPTRKEIENLIREIDKRQVRGNPISLSTRMNYRTAIKRFYKWLLGNDETYPPQVSWIKVKGSGIQYEQHEDLITEEELEKMIEACYNARDKALISTLADSGCRIGEILNLNQDHITFDEYGIVLRVDGKTGPRRVRVIGNSIAYVNAWLEAHPMGRNPKAPFLVGLTEKTQNRHLNYAQARKVIVAAAERARIEKRIHPHLFRHTKATELAKNVAEAPLEAQMGWIHGSRMARTYVHMGGRDVDEAILKANGIEIKETKRKETPRPKPCPRCETVNAAQAKFCRRCGLPLDAKAAMQMEDATRPIDESLNALFEDPKVQEFLAQKLAEKIESNS